jgi:hypothetical protein
VEETALATDYLFWWAAGQHRAPDRLLNGASVRCRDYWPLDLTHFSSTLLPGMCVNGVGTPWMEVMQHWRSPQ